MHYQTTVAIARICHQANKALCESFGDFTQVDWEQAPAWQKESAIKGVEFAIGDGMYQGVDAQHNSWLRQKQEEGWIYGSIKDADKKEHPCMVPYDALPAYQRAKDALFKNIVNSLRYME